MFDTKGVGVRLWDGERMWLPAVGRDGDLRRALQKVAQARAIPMKGPQAPSSDEA